jgi:beta-lactamase class A
VPISWAVDRGAGPVGVGVDVVVPAASTIKVLIALALWREIGEGRLDETVSLAVPVVGDGSLLDHLPGFQPTLAQLSTLMLAVSDNAATNALLALLGDAAIAAEARRLGLTATAVRRPMLDAEAVRAGRDNVTSAGDLARLCRALGEPALVPRRAAWRVLAGLAASEHRDVLGEVAPEGTLLGLKRGFNDQASLDCGLVELRGGAAGVAVCSAPPAAPDALRRAAREALSAAGA